MSKAYDILSSFYGIVSPGGIDWSMSEVITKKFTLTRGGLINTVQYLKNGIPLVEVDNNHSAQKVNDCQWRELKSFINPSNTSSVYLPFGLIKVHGYFFISTDGINKLKIDKRTFAKQLDDNVTCIINKYNAENVSSWR